MNVIDHGQGNSIKISPDLQGKLSVEVHGDGNVLTIGSSCRMPSFKIDIRANNSSISIDDQCVLIGEVAIRSANAHLQIGAKTTTMGVKITMHEAGTIRIGKDCMFAGDVRMDTSDMHSILDAATGDRLNPPGDISIADHVWLGYGVYVMKGVQIGANSVVGTGAIVTSDLGEHTLSAGVPARVIKQGITWDRRRLPMKNPSLAGTKF